MRAAALALSVFLALCGCATAQSPALPRLWYVGLGLFDETWSENDVAALPAELQRGASGFRVVSTVFANAASSHFPAVEPGAVARTLSDIGAGAGPDDVVFVYFSTHGAPGLLGRSVGGDELEPIDSTTLRDWLAPLRDRDTVLILSACFSGSFIPPLQAPHRIIFYRRPVRPHLVRLPGRRRTHRLRRRPPSRPAFPADKPTDRRRHHPRHRRRPRARPRRRPTLPAATLRRPRRHPALRRPDLLADTASEADGRHPHAHAAYPVANWTIRDVELVCRENGVWCSPPTGGGTHYKLSHPASRDILTIPARRPIKPVYIRKLVRLIEALGGNDG